MRKTGFEFVTFKTKNVILKFFYNFKTIKWFSKLVKQITSRKKKKRKEKQNKTDFFKFQHLLMI